MNVWIRSSQALWEKRLVDEFTREGIWNKVVWSSVYTEEPTHRTNINYIKLPDTYYPVPDALYQAVYPHLYVYLDMHCRFSPLGINDYSEKEVHDYLHEFNNAIAYYLKRFQEEDTHLLLLFRAPHKGNEYVQYLVAKDLGIKVLILEQAYFIDDGSGKDSFFYYTHNEDYGAFETARTIRNVEQVTIPEGYKRDIFYMKPVKQTWKQRMLQNHRIRLMYELWRSDTRGAAIRRFRQRTAFDYHVRTIAHKEVPLDVPFVYFGLHLQPEKTSSNFGGIYCDQLLALEHLSAVLPKGWKIYAKENPKQGYFMRTESFFKRLAAIPHVVYVHPSVNTYTLMHHSKLTATISGTLGFESICGGKPCVYFGWGTWYKTFPGAFAFDHSIELEKIADYNISRSDLTGHVQQLARKTGRGTIYMDWKLRRTVEEENYLLIKQSLIHILAVI